MHILGISTKIENASVTTGKSDFNILSEEVKELSFNIGDRINRINDQTRSLNNLIQTTLQDIYRIEDRQQGQADEIITRLYKDIDFLANKQTISAETMQSISGISDDIFQKMTVVISSMQFNDITRQQVEHVIEALDELTTDLKLQQKGESTSDSTDLVCKVGDVCDLQKAQLQQAKSSLNAAVEQIFTSLHGISFNAQDFSGKVNGLAESGSMDDSSFLAKMNSDITKISSLLSDAEMSNNEIVQSILTVTKTIDEMVSSLQEIEAIGNEIEMIAVNSMLKASNIGNEGAALAVMAGFIKNLSKNAQRGINTISSSLKQISQSANVLNSTIDKNKDGQDTEFRVIAGELGDLINTINNWDAQMVVSLNMIDADSTKLSANIQKEIAGFNFHKRVKTVFDRAASQLGEIADATNDLVPSRRSREHSENLQELEHKYTMESERFIHRSLGQQEPVSAHLQTAEPAVGNGSFAGDDLGDNVELF